ncbi:MAG TPA: hypothetical protein VGX28_09365 [Frankiaceae bacterium]|jgi:hypothetical protein|nr:hypothetical protein [Frankiaceae bacterium]
MKKSRILKVAAATVGGVLALGGIAYAAWGAVVQPDGQIYACYGADGTMHVKENDGTTGYTTCPDGQKLMSWNQRGLRGPTGPMGMPGPAYFTRVLTTDNATVKPAMTPIKTWNYTDGTVWINVPEKDVRNCAVTATPVGAKPDTTVIRQPVDYKDWVLLYTYTGTARTQTAVDVVLACWS